MATTNSTSKICPECGHQFQGNGWDGIDAHWRAKHDHIMPYKEAWPLIKAGAYKHCSTTCCSICGETKPATSEYFGKKGTHGYCKPCERTRNWLDRHQGEKVRNDWVAFMRKRS